jgi:hypothetical protein
MTVVPSGIRDVVASAVATTLAANPNWLMMIPHGIPVSTF